MHRVTDGRLSPYGWLNLIFSGNPIVTVTSWVTLAAGAFPGVSTLAKVYGSGIDKSPPTFWLCVLVSLLLPSLLALLLPLRWHLIYRKLRQQLDWFRTENNRHRVLVGIGPGGAILTGMIAKLVGEAERKADRMGKEPLSVVLDRVYERDEYNEIRASISTVARIEMQPAPKKQVILVTPEVHEDKTLLAACETLDAMDIGYSIFAFLWNPAKRDILPEHDRLVILESNSRGILPWPDAPEKSHTHHAG